MRPRALARFGPGESPIDCGEVMVAQSGRSTKSGDLALLTYYRMQSRSNVQDFNMEFLISLVAASRIRYCLDVCRRARKDVAVDLSHVSGPGSESSLLL